MAGFPVQVKLCLSQHPLQFRIPLLIREALPRSFLLYEAHEGKQHLSYDAAWNTLTQILSRPMSASLLTLVTYRSLTLVKLPVGYLQTPDTGRDIISMSPQAMTHCLCDYTSLPLVSFLIIWFLSQYLHHVSSCHPSKELISLADWKCIFGLW